MDPERCGRCRSRPTSREELEPMERILGVQLRKPAEQGCDGNQRSIAKQAGVSLQLVSML